MERRQRAGLITILGIILFFVSLIFILPFSDLYLAALILMFIGVVMIGIGGAMLKGFDKELDHPEVKCYHCGGTGKVEEGDGVCSRCGGTGYTPPDAL